MSTFRHNGQRRCGGRWIEDVKLLQPTALERAGRRAARALGLEDVLFEPPPEVRAARGNGDLRGARRINGRWARGEEQHRQRHRLARLVAARVWYLLVPLLGLAWANAAYVRPAVENIRWQQDQERQAMLDRQDDLRAEITRLQSQVVELGALIDTLQVPEIRFHQVRLDSLTLVRKTTERNPQLLQARLDSLRTFGEYLAVQLEEGAGQMAELKAEAEHLAGRRVTVQDSLARLDRLLAASSAELERREDRRDLQGVVSRFWYIVAPVVGMMWAHDS